MKIINAFYSAIKYRFYKFSAFTGSNLCDFDFFIFFLVTENPDFHPCDLEANLFPIFVQMLCFVIRCCPFCVFVTR